MHSLEIWQKEYTTKILSSDHPLIYLFAISNGDINARDKYLLTPLHYAVAHNNLSGIKQLVTFNADLEVSLS
jgi:ankyrin repeat protein